MKIPMNKVANTVHPYVLVNTNSWSRASAAQIYSRPAKVATMKEYRRAVPLHHRSLGSKFFAFVSPFEAPASSQGSPGFSTSPMLPIIETVLHEL